MNILLSLEEKTSLVDYCPNISLDTIFMNTKNSKTSERHKFVLNLTQRVDFRNSKKYVALQNFSIYYT